MLLGSSCEKSYEAVFYFNSQFVTVVFLIKQLNVQIGYLYDIVLHYASVQSQNTQICC